MRLLYKMKQYAPTLIEFILSIIKFIIVTKRF